MYPHTRLKAPEKAAFFTCLALTLTACGPLVELPGSGPAASLFMLDPLLEVETQSVVDIQKPIIVIHEPEMPAALAVDHIAIMPQENELRYLPDARWVEKTPRLIQSFLVESLSNLGTFTVIGAGVPVASSAYHLFMRIDDFQIDAQADNSSPRIDISVRINLVESTTNNLVVSERLIMQHDIESASPHQAITGFSAALGMIARKIDDVVLDHIKPHTR